jgi:diadenylate cyclase
VNALDQLRAVSIGWREAVQALLLGYVLYRVVRSLRGTRAVQMLTALAMLVAAYGVAWLLQLQLITYALGFVFRYGVIAVLVVFAPELRSALAHLGQARFARVFSRMEEREVVEEVVEAVERLSRSGIGAIVAIEHEVALDAWTESGSPMEAKVSADLLTTIFTPYSPLHDGAVVIRGDLIVAAGCILPLSQQAIADRTLGTRHRAALGLADESDAVIVVVSEERSTVSVAERGRLWRDLNPAELRELLSGRRPTRVGSAGTSV